MKHTMEGILLASEFRSIERKRKAKQYAWSVADTLLIVAFLLAIFGGVAVIAFDFGSIVEATYLQVLFK